MESVNKVSLLRVIGNVMGNLGIKDVDDSIDDFARWACEASNKIGSTSSYKRFECEINIRNRKAALPPNFVYLNAIKFGNKIVPVTKRSFRMFNKGKVENLSDNNQNRDYVSGNKQTDIPGVPLVIRVNFSGAFMVGDIITITIATNNCGELSTNTFTHIVVAGDTLTSIGATFASQINAIPNIGYTATPSTESFVLTADSPEIILTVTPYTDSVNGTVSQEVVQKRVPTKIRTSGDSSQKPEIRTTSKNLADANVARLNTGINRQGPNGGSYRSFGYDYDFNSSDQVFSIDNGCINFNAYDDEKIGISYMGIEVDEDGWPLISEIHEDAVTHYLMYMYKAREYYAGKLPNHVFKELQTRWFDLCGQARGDDELPNSEELKYLSNLWMQLVPLPTKEYF